MKITNDSDLKENITEQYNEDRGSFKLNIQLIVECDDVIIKTDIKTIDITIQEKIITQPEGGVSRWTCNTDDTDDLTVTDVWNNNNGKIEGSGITTGHEPPDKPSLGTKGESYKYDGTDSYINVEHNNSIDIRKTVSFSFWIYVNSFGDSWQMIFGKLKEGSNTDGRTYSAWLNSSGYMHLTSSSDEAGQTSINTEDGYINKNAWYHFIGVINR